MLISYHQMSISEYRMGFQSFINCKIEVHWKAESAYDFKNHYTKKCNSTTFRCMGNLRPRMNFEIPRLNMQDSTTFQSTWNMTPAMNLEMHSLNTIHQLLSGAPENCAYVLGRVITNCALHSLQSHSGPKAVYATLSTCVTIWDTASILMPNSTAFAGIK